MTCHPNMTNVLIAFVFLFTGKQKSGCRQLQVFNHRWHCCMFAYKSFYVNLRKFGIKSNNLGYVRLNGSCIYHKNGNPIYLKEVIVKLKGDNQQK